MEVSALKGVPVANVGADASEDVGVQLGLGSAVGVNAAGKDTRRACAAAVGTASDGAYALVHNAVRAGRACGGKGRVAADVATYRILLLPPQQVVRQQRSGSW